MFVGNVLMNLKVIFACVLLCGFSVVFFIKNKDAQGNLTTMVDKKVFIQKLNGALELEYAAVIQYVQHAAVMTGPAYTDIADELATHAKEEFEHAQQVSDIIVDFGGTPSIEVKKRFISGSPQTMLEQDLNGEQIAIDSYKELIAMAENIGEPGYAYTLRLILAKEEEHRRDVIRALGR